MTVIIIYFNLFDGINLPTQYNYLDFHNLFYHFTILIAPLLNILYDILQLILVFVRLPQYTKLYFDYFVTILFEVSLVNLVNK